MDVHTKEQRSYNMSRIKGKDTGPEIQVRHFLWKDGYRYRLHVKDLPGKPDIVLPKYQAVILVHGCFWHRHSCSAATVPASNQHFWSHKFETTIQRDKQNIKELKKKGWRVMIIWECALKDKRGPELLLNQIRVWLDSDRKFAQTRPPRL